MRPFPDSLSLFKPHLHLAAQRFIQHELMGWGINKGPLLRCHIIQFKLFACHITQSAFYEFWMRREG